MQQVSQPNITRIGDTTRERVRQNSNLAVQAKLDQVSSPSADSASNPASRLDRCQLSREIEDESLTSQDSLNMGKGHANLEALLANMSAEAEQKVGAALTRIESTKADGVVAGRR